MIDGKKLSAIVPVRAGSQRVINKNIKKFADSNLIDIKLSELKKVSKIDEIILIFGCGGNRDKGKRKQMALIANKYADKVIVTSDNPRDENPYDILNTIEKNLSINNEVIESREDAIKRGLMLVKKKSVLLIAGKGHENFQEVKGVKTPFSDKEVALTNIGLINN